MELESELLERNVLKIILDGRLDIVGTNAIAKKLAALTETKCAGTIMDMGKVDFVASIGIRALLSSAKACSAHGSKLILFNLQPLVKDVLKTCGVATLIPIFDDEQEALQFAHHI